MFRPLIAATVALALAGCAGGGPQDIRIEGAGAPAPLAAGPHALSAAERGAVQTALAAQARGAGIGSMNARRGDDGVVTVCGVLNSGAPFLGILTGQAGRPGFSLAGIGPTEPEARAVRKICAERGVTV